MEVVHTNISRKSGGRRLIVPADYYGLHASRLQLLYGSGCSILHPVFQSEESNNLISDPQHRRGLALGLEPPDFVEYLVRDVLKELLLAHHYTSAVDHAFESFSRNRIELFDRNKRYPLCLSLLHDRPSNRVFRLRF